MDRVAFGDTLRQDGYSIVHTSLPPNMAADDHAHAFDARIMVLGGEITITRAGKPHTFKAGDCCEVPAGCWHAEAVGPEGVALLSGRRRHGPPTATSFEEDLRREGWDVRFGGQKAGYSAGSHAHGFDARIMVLGGEITLTINGKPTTYKAGDWCEVPCGTMHAEQVGPNGVSTLAGVRTPARV